MKISLFVGMAICFLSFSGVPNSLQPDDWKVITEFLCENPPVLRPCASMRDGIKISINKGQEMYCFFDGEVFDGEKRKCKQRGCINKRRIAILSYYYSNQNAESVYKVSFRYECGGEILGDFDYDRVTGVRNLYYIQKVS